MAEHSDAAEQIDEQTPPDEGTDVDERDADADLAESAEMTAPQRFSDTRALITVGFVIFAALAGVGGWLGYRVYQDTNATFYSHYRDAGGHNGHFDLGRGGGNDWPTSGQQLAAMSADLAANIR